MTTTFKEAQHPRGPGGKFANKNGAKPKPKSQQTRRRIGGGVAASSATMFLASGFNFGSSILNLGTALFTVATVSLLAWGGYKGNQKRKARKKTNQLGQPRGHRPASRGRSLTPAQIRAKADAKLQKKKVKHELHKDWFASLFGPSRVTKSDWSAT